MKPRLLTLSDRRWLISEVEGANIHVFMFCILESIVSEICGENICISHPPLPLIDLPRSPERMRRDRGSSVIEGGGEGHIHFIRILPH